MTLFGGDKKDSIVKCRLQSYRLTESPPFEALSYRWGDHTDTTPIVINEDFSFGVTKNLKSALLHLRKPDTPRTLWIDAICINQTDVDERSDQVQIMTEIYRRSLQTLVWLGDRSAHSHLVFEKLNELLSEKQSGGVETGFQPANLKSSFLRYAGNTQPGYRDDDFEGAVISFAEREWFDRVWVVQEVGVARKARIICGDQDMDWDDFSTGVEIGVKRGIFSTVFLGVVRKDIFQNFRAITELKKETGHDGIPADELLRLLTTFRPREATDPSDKCFALLGLVDGSHTELGLQADYRLSTNKVYSRTAVAILSNSNNLDLLGQCVNGSQENPQFDLPSWVPDWSYAAAIPRALNKDSLGQPSNFRATGDSVPDPTFFHDKGALIMSGLLIDQIAAVSSIRHEDIENEIETLLDATDKDISDDEDDNDWDESVFMSILHTARKVLPIFGRGLLRFLQLVVSRLEVYVEWEKFARIDNEGNKRRYIETLCAGCTPSGYEKTAADFEEWRKSMRAIRGLASMGVEDLPKLYTPLAFLAYVRDTWSKYGDFNALLEHTSLRRLARTRKGHLCLVPSDTKAGDSVALFAGGRVPLIVRRDTGARFRLLGESYVHGIMNGEEWEPNACERIVLV
ncbi:heterokaryon incompatibility protein-domain-containing protein [Xylogone sp. PMI_703]|nr:heterokaryon incompatibility protein-domain-containing protein [Xylogone sp. PMI_703]